MEQKKALITGITGQDGSYLAEFLLEKDYRVYGLIRRSATPNLKNLSKAGKHANFSLINGDLTDLSSLIIAINTTQPDEVYNLAAQSHVRISFDEPFHTLRVTGEGAINVFEAVRLIKPTTRVYQAGSSEQFGCSMGNHYLQDEFTTMIPQSPYGCAKMLAYNAAGMYRRAYSAHISVGILFNHESPRRGENFVTQKIAKYISSLRRFLEKTCGERFYKKSNIELQEALVSFPKLKLGNLDASRDWGLARDYVEAMWLMLQQAQPDDYVIATGESHTIREFLTESLKCVMLSHLDYNSFVETDTSLFRPAEVNYLCGDARRANRLLGWKPKNSFKDIVRIMTAAQYNGFE